MCHREANKVNLPYYFNNLNFTNEEPFFPKEFQGCKIVHTSTNKKKELDKKLRTAQKNGNFILSTAITNDDNNTGSLMPFLPVFIICNDDKCHLIIYQLIEYSKDSLEQWNVTLNAYEETFPARTILTLLSEKAHFSDML